MSVSIIKHTPAYYTLCNIITLTIQKTIAVASITMITVDIVLERNGTEYRYRVNVQKYFP